MREGRKIGASEIEPLLRELGERMAARGLTGSVYVFGGAAVVLRYGSRDLTEDIDARMSTRAMLAQAEAMAGVHGLPLDWLNDAGHMFMPATADDVEAHIDVYGGLTVRIASPRFLLAGKLYAGRIKDQADIITLLRELGIDRADTAVDVVHDVYGEDTVPTIDFDDLRLFVREMLLASRRQAGS